MKRIVFIASHLGYPMEKTPLGGGAMVGLHLARRWANQSGFEFISVGSGPQNPHPGSADYVQLPAPRYGAKSGNLVSLSERQYAAFCRSFERDSTEWLLKERRRFPPDETCVVVNDICEGPNMETLSQAGYSVVSIWHVDVIDYFSKIYLHGLVGPARLAGVYETIRRAGVSALVPDMLRLIFEKQRQTVVYSHRLIFPSTSMAEVVRRCYGSIAGSDFENRAQVVPWGAWEEDGAPVVMENKIREIKAHYQISPQSQVLMTLSRIAPEKGLHLLLEALRILEQQGSLTGQDVCLFLCGEPAFMRGLSYMRQVRRAADRLRRVRVFFPGYLGPTEKKVFFSLSQLFISPSIHESYGLNMIEAMRAGLPVLALNHYGAKDMPEEGVGRWVEAKTGAQAPRELARALQDLLSQPQQLILMGERARDYAAQMPFSKAADTVLESALSSILPRALAALAL